MGSSYIEYDKTLKRDKTVNKKSLDNLKKFTKDYQPAREKLRKPKWKTHLKKLLAEDYETVSKAILDKCKNGDIRHIEFLRDWLYGKVKDKVQIEGSFNKQLQEYLDGKKRVNADDDTETMGGD